MKKIIKKVKKTKKNNGKMQSYVSFLNLWSSKIKGIKNEFLEKIQK